MAKKILLMYITNVSGHHSATLSIEKAIIAEDPCAQVLNINGFSYVSPLMEKLVHRAYIGVIKKLPFIWRALYDNPALINSSERLKKRINQRNEIKIRHLIESQNYNVILCSQAFPCGFAAEYKRLNPDRKVKLIAVTTDFIPHSYWVYDEVDFYIVASEDAKRILINKGIAENKIKILGIPIDLKFNIQLEKSKAAEELRISLDKPVILIMGGGHGIGPIEKLIKTMDAANIDMKIMVVAGINKKLYKSLKNGRFRKEVHVFGYIDYIEKLMSLADVIITKPGGITTSEALARNIPMIIIKPIPGQEQNNTRFLLKNGLAQKADSVEQAVEKLCGILEDRGQIDTMKENILRCAHPGSSKEIAKLALSLC